MQCQYVDILINQFNSKSGRKRSNPFGMHRLCATVDACLRGLHSESTCRWPWVGVRYQPNRYETVFFKNRLAILVESAADGIHKTDYFVQTVLQVIFLVIISFLNSQNRATLPWPQIWLHLLSTPETSYSESIEGAAGRSWKQEACDYDCTQRSRRPPPAVHPCPPVNQPM